MTAPAARRFKVEIGMYVEGPASLRDIDEARWLLNEDTMNEVLDALGADRKGGQAEFAYLSVEPAEADDDD